MTMLPRIVLPAVATLGVLYPTSFLLGMWKSAENGDIDAKGDLLSGGEIASGWRYEVYERNFPRSYRMDMSAAEKGLGSLCILEVRDGATRPVSAVSGGGSLVYVTLDKPVNGARRVMIDMAEVDRARCAGVITDGQLYAGGKVSTRFAQAGSQAGGQTERARLHALDEDAQLVVQQLPAGQARAIGM